MPITDLERPMSQLTLVIPAWNEATCLPVLLDSIEVAHQRWLAAASGAAQLQVIVADNASTDATASIAVARGCQVAPVVRRVIAAARNGGAALADGEILAFVDADSRIHPDTFIAIERAMRDPRTLGGATGVSMQRWSPGIALTYASMLPMVWLSGFDTGVVFWRRADFVALGGFDESRAVAEDIDFLLRLRRLGRQRGQRWRRLRGVKAITSTRKFDRFGDWHYFTRVPALLWALLGRRGQLQAFIRRYWYEGR